MIGATGERVGMIILGICAIIGMVLLAYMSGLLFCGYFITGDVFGEAAAVKDLIGMFFFGGGAITIGVGLVQILRAW